MRSQAIFLFGYGILVAAVIGALWKLHVLERIGYFWTAIIISGMVGVDIMMAMARVGREIKIDR